MPGRRLPRLLLALALSAAPLTQHAHADDWGVTRDPFDPNVIARYKGMLRANPYDATSLARLLDMYRRYRTLDLLKSEYDKELAKKPDDWALLVIDARLFRSTGDEPHALELFQKAVAAKATDAAGWLAIGELQKNANKPAEARAAYDKALAHASQKDMKKKALRALADLALAQQDNEGANTYFKQFLELDPQNAQLWIERGDAMLAAKKPEIAIESYAAAEKLLGSDPQRKMEVIARRGQALEALGRDDDAVVEYRRAIKAAPKGYYLETELTGRIIDIYRKKQALPALLAQYEKEWSEGSRGHFEWNTLGKLYEETGQQDKAIAALRKAVAKSPWELETQRHLISLLENSGRDDEALAQYEAVVRVAPGEARFQTELAERYWRRGKEKQALETVARLEQRFPTDPGVIGSIADMYSRWGKDDLALVEYEKLAKIEPEDPSHLVTLGEQYWQKGDKTKAWATWKRLTLSGKAGGFAKYGEVQAEHGQASEALASYDKAIKLEDKNGEHYKGRAAVFEQQRQYDKAIDDYLVVLKLIDDKPQNRMAKRDARKKIVALVLRTTATGAQPSPIEAKYRDQWTREVATADAKGIEAGYFLADYYAKRDAGKLVDTLKTLRKRVPEDQEVITDLVKAYKDVRKYDEAVALLLELAKLAPSRERDVYTQISEIKTLARKDDEAIEWAQKALAKSPTDPQAYERLGERYVEMQRFDDAIKAYEQTVKLDAHNSKAHFALAQLYIQSGVPLKATELYRNVLRTTTVDEEVAHAADAAIDLEEMTGTLGELEKVLSPLSFVMAHKPIYRRKLVALYERYVPLLVERMRHGNDEIRKAARAELDRIGGHGLQPLLEALRDEKDLNQQRLAVGVLGHLGNKGAAQPLVRIARQEPVKDPMARRMGGIMETAELNLRVDALVAAGRLGDPSVIADVLPLVDHQESAMREAAIFTIGRTGDRRALPALVKALDDKQTSVRTLACLGLGNIDDPKAVAALAGAVADTRKPEAARAACAFALGARRATAGEPALFAALADNRGDTQRLAAWALGQIGDAKALGALVRAYFARAGRPGDELVWAIARTSAPKDVPASQLPYGGDFPQAGGKYAPFAAVAQLPGNLPPAPNASARLVGEHADEIAKGLVDALGEHRDVVVSVLADLDAAPNQLALGALPVPDVRDPKTKAALDTIGAAIAPQVAANLTADDPKVRALAISVTAKLDSPKQPGADAAIAKALTDPADQVREAAMNAVATLAVRRGAAPAPLVAALVHALTTAPWADRRVAALAIGRLGPHADLAALAKAASDPSNFVREAVATAYGMIGSPAVLEPLNQLANDPQPSVQAAARAALSHIKH